MNPRRFVLLTFTVGILAACTGCMQTLKFSYNPGLAPVPTLPCPVALNLNQEFTNYLQTAGVFHAPLGPVLQKYAIYVTQSVFGDVQVLDGQPPRNDAKLLLVPRVTSADLHPEPPGSGAFGIHWDFNDPKTGQTLFSMQVQCEYIHPFYFFPRRPPLPDVVDHLMTNLTSITIQRFNASKDIQRLSGH
jgi:hypothetical protein